MFARTSARSSCGTVERMKNGEIRTYGMVLLSNRWSQSFALPGVGGGAGF
jgi:hypothetical protein